MAPAPMKIGLYFFEKMMTSKSTPVVLTVAPGQVTVASTSQLLLDAPAQQLNIKRSRATGAVTLTTPQGKLILSALGSNSGESFTAEQTAEIVAAQQVAATDPQAAQLELGRTLWVGQPIQADGSYQGALRSMAQGDSKAQRKIGVIVADALVAAGVQQG